MSAFTVSLIPIFALILLGFGMRRIGFLPDAAWAGMEKLTYFVLFPALLIRTLGNQALAGTPWPGMLTVVAGVLALATLVLLVFRFLRRSESGATFTSIFQGGIRFNTYISLAVAQGLFGEQGLALASLAAGFMIALINFLCISAFVIWGNSNSGGIRFFLRELFANPLIIACVIGWTLSITGIGISGVVEDIFEIVGRAALPFGLLAVGAALKPSALGGHALPITVSSIVQFGLKPIATAWLIAATGVTGTAAAVLLIGFMTPTAPSAYILARQLGGDTDTMASIITFQTLLAFVCMPLIARFLLP